MCTKRRHLMSETDRRSRRAVVSPSAARGKMSAVVHHPIRGVVQRIAPAAVVSLAFYHRPPTEIQATWFPNAGAASLRFRQPEFLASGGAYQRGIGSPQPSCRRSRLTMHSSAYSSWRTRGAPPPERTERNRSFPRPCASSGAQVVIETHSDHVSTSQAGGRDRSTIEPSKVLVHFLTQRPNPRGNTRKRTVGSPKTRDGGLPESFFDHGEDLDFSLGAASGT